MDAVFTDVSQWQTSPYTDAYPLRIASFRVADGTNSADLKFSSNLAWCRSAYSRGKLDAYIGYFVYRPQPPATLFAHWRSIVGALPPGMALMLDVESWDNQITGNQSAYLNTLYGLLSAWAGSFNRVIGYGNKSDLAGLWPQRDPRCRVIVAHYGPQIVTQTISGCIGQQYTDGTYAGPPGLPTATAPFGKVDHNVFPGLTSQALAQLLNVKPVSTPPVPIEDGPDMFMLRNSTSGAVELYLGNGHFVPVLATDYPVWQKAGITQYSLPPGQYALLRASLVATTITALEPIVSTTSSTSAEIAAAVRSVLVSTPLKITGTAS